MARSEISEPQGAARHASSLVVGAFTVALLLGLALNDGGYWPTAWGWAALALAWAIVAALLVYEPRLTALQLSWLGVWGAFVAWCLASLAWSTDVPQTMLEVERSILFILVVVASSLLRRLHVSIVLACTAVSIVAACGYGLATRLMPDRLGLVEAFSRDRLSEPIGYWNGLGAFAVIGALLALGFVARAGTPAARACAAAAVPVLGLTLYYTFSRGAWIALGIGLVGVIALDPRRVQFTVAAIAPAVASAIVVLTASQTDSVAHGFRSFSEAVADGHRVALLLVLVGVGASVVTFALAASEQRVAVPPPIRAAYVATLVVVLVAAMGAAILRFGSPIEMVRDAHQAFTAPPPQASVSVTNPNERLFTFWGNGRPQEWRVAWNTFRERPVTGRGAGTYEQAWNQERTIDLKVRDAHSLYFETLAELGAVGFLILLVALLVPLVAAIRARRRRLVPVAFGAYLAYLVHAGVDWDWELPAVTLAAVVCASTLLVAARDRRARVLSPPLRYGALAVTVLLGAGAFVALLGNKALADSDAAFARRDFAATAERARDARRWAPWSSEPWRRLAEVRTARGDLAGARAAYRRALELDPENWELWLGYAGSSQGLAKRRALARMGELNPLARLDPETGGNAP